MPVCNDEAMKTKESSIGDNAPMTNRFLLSSESNSIVSKFFKLTLFNNAGVEI